MPLDIIVGGGMLLLAAEVATWCFKAGAKEQRRLRKEVVRQERQKRSQIIRETNRRLAQEAYEQRGAWLDMLSECMDQVWEMRKHTRDLQSQLNSVIKANQSLLRNSPLTFDQQDAIRDCIFHLERGVARLSAYSGPYLQHYIDNIKQAKSAALGNHFINPKMPDSSLPEDFPAIGENFKLSNAETESFRRTGRLKLSHGQVGRFDALYPWEDKSSNISVFVSDYDRDKSQWILSPAKGMIAAKVHDRVDVPLQVVVLSHTRGGCETIWHSPFGESIEMFLPYSLADNHVRSAPWGTCLPLFIQQTDYRTRRITVGQTPPSSPDESGRTLNVAVESSEAVSAIKAAFSISPDTFWLRNQEDSQLAVRIATGEEYAVFLDSNGKTLNIGQQIGYRLGLVDGEICKSSVELRIKGVDESESNSISPIEFLKKVTQRLDEQAELRSIFQEEVLESNKYQMLLEAVLEASRSESGCSCLFSNYHVSTDSDSRPEVTFVIEDGKQGDVSTQMAAEVVTRSRRFQGYVSHVDAEQGHIRCVFGPDVCKSFRSNEVDKTGRLEFCVIDPDIRRQVRALEQFRNVKFLQGKSAEEKEAFRMLRRTLLGLPNTQKANKQSGNSSLKVSDTLNANQKRAIRLINSDNPLTLILGPPGTGKTDTIAIAIETYLRQNPNARVAVVSQANVAVDEALFKLKSRFPECDVLRHASLHALESLAASSKELTQHRLRDNFLRNLTQQDADLSETACLLRDRFRLECKDESFVTHRILKTLGESASVYGCTLSMLGRLSSGAALFDLVVIDEAAKASLPECMIAAIAAKRLVLVGDHNQLLPFLDEKILDRAGKDKADRKTVEDLWNNSLFKRMWEKANDDIKVLLETQYRSRSAIRKAISVLFYDNRLKPGRTDDSEGVPLSSSLVWVDTLRLGSHRQAGSSLVNEGEADCVLSTIEMLGRTLPNPSSVTIAVICFYGAQRNLIERKLEAFHPASRFKACESRTVDASQGGQWDIVILPLTRCSGSTSFVGNANRLNVALSRAKELAVVVGNFQFCLKDRMSQSRLGDLARYVQDHSGEGIRICAPAPDGSISTRFGLRGSTRPLHRSNKRHGN
jgi:hypothetical protein